MPKAGAPRIVHIAIWLMAMVFGCSAAAQPAAKRSDVAGGDAAVLGHPERSISTWTTMAMV